ncbi:MAG: polyprenyl synthetase family protein, partial [Paracoccaceae bacterium]
MLKELNHKPHDQLAEILAPEMARVDALIRERMRS